MYGGGLVRERDSTGDDTSTGGLVRERDSTGDDTSTGGLVRERDSTAVYLACTGSSIGTAAPSVLKACSCWAIKSGLLGAETDTAVPLCRAQDAVGGREEGRGGRPPGKVSDYNWLHNSVT